MRVKVLDDIAATTDIEPQATLAASGNRVALWSIVGLSTADALHAVDIQNDSAGAVVFATKLSNIMAPTTMEGPHAKNTEGREPLAYSDLNKTLEIVPGSTALSGLIFYTIEKA